MCNRRNKPIFQGAILLALVGGLGYTFYLHNLTKIDLEISRSETERYFKQQESLSSQLQVVYEHRARLERSLQNEKTDHKSTKLEFSKKQNDFLLNVTRSKHEAMNRFNSLETQYNMLKAQAKELDTDYNRLQQQYSRVSSEHSAVNNQQRRNFQLYKEQKTNEIASLDEEIKTLKQQVVSLRTHLKSKTEEAEQYKITSSRALAASQKYQEMLSTLQEQLSNYRERLKSYASQSKTDKAASREAKHDKEELGETRHQDSKMKRIVEQGEKVVPRQEKESPTGLSRGERRHHQNHPRRQVHVQITPPGDNDADQADMRRPPDENVNDQKQVDESRGGIKANEGNIPLRDTNIRLADAQHGVKATSPTQSAMNKWADILKATEQGHKVLGLKREDSSKGVKKEWEGESEEGRNRLNGDHKQEAAAGNNNQRQLGEEEVLDEQDGKPVEQAGHVADRPVQQGYQANNVPVAQIEKPVTQGHVVDIPGEQEGEQDNQGYEFNEKNKEETHKEDEADDLSRENINKQVAEMQENHQQEQIKQQEKLEAVQSRVAPIPAVQRQVAPIPAVQRQVAPIPAVQRQVETAQEHRAKADADNDDEDADNDQADDQDPDEDDPDDADQEDGDNLEAHDSRQEQQVHHDDRTFDRSLKAADDNKQQN